MLLLFLFIRSLFTLQNKRKQKYAIKNYVEILIWIFLQFISFCVYCGFTINVWLIDRNIIDYTMTACIYFVSLAYSSVNWWMLWLIDWMINWSMNVCSDRRLPTMRSTTSPQGAGSPNGWTNKALQGCTLSIIYINTVNDNIWKYDYIYTIYSAPLTLPLFKL